MHFHKGYEFLLARNSMLSFNYGKYSSPWIMAKKQKKKRFHYLCFHVYM